MSIAKCCPYSDEKENCKFEIYSGHPRFDKCSTCERFLKQKFPDIDTSKFNIDENGNVLRDKRMSEEKIFKGFPLDEKGCVQGAYPCFSSVVESQVKKITELENEFVMKIFRNLHIDTDVLMKQKAEIDRLSFENEQLKAQIEKMKCCFNCENFFVCSNEKEKIKYTKRMRMIKFPCCWRLRES